MSYSEQMRKRLSPDQVPGRLLIHGVLDAGSPNFERVLLESSGSLQLTGFGLAIAFRAKDGRLQTFHDQCFWFPDMSITGPSLVLVHSRAGEPEWSEYNNLPVFNLFWGKPTTVFSREQPNVIPLLFRVDAAEPGGII